MGFMYPWHGLWSGGNKQEMAAAVFTSSRLFVFGISYLCGTKTEPINRAIKRFNAYLPI